MDNGQQSGTLKLYVAGVNYKKADTTTRSLFSISAEGQSALIEDAVAKGMKALLVISTCNRTEIIGFAEHPFQLIELLSNYWQNGTVKEFSKVAYVYKSSEAVNHLFRLVSGLDSQILGDYEIVGQLKRAFQLSKSLGGINTFFDKLFSFLMHASKLIKNETQLSSGTTSVSYAAVQYMVNAVGDLSDKTILVYGLGEIGKNTYKHLVEYTAPKKILIANRSQDKLEKLMVEKPKNVEVYYIDNLVKRLVDVDFMIVATGADHPTVKLKDIPKDKELLILDLSMPSNVAQDVKELSKVTLVDLDYLSKITDATLHLRQDEIPKAESLIKEVEKEFYEWLDQRKFSPAIKALKKSLDVIRRNEMNMHDGKKDCFSYSDLDEVADHLMQKVVRQFAKHIRANSFEANQTIDLITRIFEIDKSELK